MRPPPSRYKVVERGRRLEVIDTRTGAPVSPTVVRPLGGARRAELGAGPRDLSAPPVSVRRSATAGNAGVETASLVTRRWFDDKAPRTIRMNFANRQRLLNLRWGIAIAVALLVGLSFLFWPLAVVLVAALAAGPGLRAQLRVASTSWLDGFDRT